MPLTLAKETIEMHWKEQLGRQSAQILLEGDMIVPDSQPDLQKILECEGEITLTEQRVGEERVFFSGALQIHILYTAKNGEHPLYALQTSLPIEDLIHMDGLGQDAEVALTAELEHLDCRIINDRKLGLKAVVAITAQAERARSMEILGNLSGEGIEALQGSLRMETDAIALQDRFSVKEDLTLPMGQAEIGTLLRESVTLTEQEIRPMDGKVLLRGNVLVSILYTDAEGRLDSFAEKIPFSGYLEQEELDAATAVTGTLTIASAKLTPQPDEDGELRQLAVDIAIAADLEGRRTEETEILLDAYAPRGVVELQRESITYPMTVASGKNQFTLKERIRPENGEQPMLRVEDAWGEVRLAEARMLENGVEAEGVLTVSVLYHCAEDSSPICILHRGIPFTQTMELRGVSTEDTPEVSLRLDELDFQMLSDQEGELRATLTMESRVERLEEAEVVTDAAWQENPTPMPPLPGAMIYMVQPGDSLWTIAKRYHTTIDAILAVNEIENPDLIYPGQKLLILKRMR